MEHNPIIISSEGEEQVNLLVGKEYVEIYYWNSYTILRYDRKSHKLSLQFRSKKDKDIVKKALRKLTNELSSTIRDKIKIALLA